jgi:acetyltransferase-like isoleucine patch superfamily enzyme
MGTLLAIVVLPAAMDIVRSDIAGRPAGDYLLEGLRSVSGIEVRVVDDSQIDPHGRSSKSDDVSGFPATSLDAGDLASRDVLVIDARTWIPRGLLTNLLSRVGQSSEPFRLTDSPIDPASGAKTIAVFYPAGRLLPGVFERDRTTPQRGLDSVVTAAELARTVSIAAADLGVGPVLLIDSYADLAAVEAHVILDRANEAMARGVRLRVPHQVWLRGDLVCGSNVEIDINVIIEGTVVLGNGVRVGANCILRDCRVGESTRINPFSLLEQANIGTDCVVGPYARIRPGSFIGDHVQIGNYVEVKNSEVGSHSRINHHAFIGDASIGDEVTIGAGTITCNHDGVRINRTVIERGAYVGSGCNLVAPVRIGERATVGAGSTITRDVPGSKLTLARAQQTTIDNWRGPRGS